MIRGDEPPLSDVADAIGSCTLVPWRRRKLLKLAGAAYEAGRPHVQAAAVRAERKRMAEEMTRSFWALDEDTRPRLAALIVRWAAAGTEDRGLLAELASLLDQEAP